MAEFIGVKSYKAKGRRLTNYMVDDVHEIEPVVKKESGSDITMKDEEEGHENPLPPVRDDPAQMKLEL